MNSVIQHKNFSVHVLSKEKTWSWAIVSLDGFPLGNIFARQQSIVGPISNGKEACVVVFPTVLLVLVHGPLRCFSGLRQVGKPHYFCLCRVDHHVCVVPHVPPSHKKFINSSLVNLNVLNYIMERNEVIFRVYNGYSHVSHALDCYCMNLFCRYTKPTWLIILVRRFKPLSSLPEVHIMALSGAHEIAHFLQVVTCENSRLSDRLVLSVQAFYSLWWTCHVCHCYREQRTRQLS